jgi:hypothetical protein
MRTKSAAVLNRVRASRGAVAIAAAPAGSAVAERRAWHPAVLLAFFFVVGCAVYANVLTAFFIHDDFILLNLAREKGLANYWSISRYFRPLVSLTVYTDYTLWKVNPLGYHLTNMLFHAVNAWLVVLLARRLMEEADLMGAGRDGMAFFAGMFFLVLHSHTEAVSWIIARSDLVVSFFGLSSLYTYLLYRRDGERRYLMTSLALYAAALLSKEAAITFPLVIGAYELYRYLSESDRARRSFRPFAATAAYFALLVPYFALRDRFLGAVIGGHGNGLSFKFTTVALGLVLFPLRMVVPYVALHRPPGDLLPGISFRAVVPILLLGGLLLLALGVVAGRIALRSARRVHGKQLRELLLLLPFLAIAFYVLLVPAVNVGIVSIQNTVGERFLYFPSAFGAIFVALLLRLVVARTRHLIVIACLLVLGSAVALYRSNANWRGAGEIARTVLQSLMEQPAADRLLILNLPDQLNGAYVYRNRTAITEALHLFRDAPQIGEIAVCAYNTLCDPRDATLVSGSAGSYAVRLENPRDYFRLDEHPRERSSWATDYSLTAFTPGSFHLTLKQLERKDRIVYYSAGKLVPVPR